MFITCITKFGLLHLNVFEIRKFTLKTVNKVYPRAVFEKCLPCIRHKYFIILNTTELY